MGRTSGKMDVSPITVILLTLETSHSPNPKRTKRRRKTVIPLSNAGSATRQDTHSWNAEHEKPNTNP